MNGSHNLAEDGNLENEKLALIAGQICSRTGSHSTLSSRIDQAVAI